MTDVPDEGSLAKGWRLQEAGDLDGAEATFRRAVSDGEAEAERFLGALLVVRGRAEEALTVLRQGLEKGDIDCQLHLGNALCDVGDFDAALEAFRMAADLGDAAGWHSYGSVLRTLGRFEEAIPAWRIAYEAEFLSPFVFASLLADARRYDEAVDVLKPVAEAGEGKAWVEIGAIEQERGELVAAEAALRRGVAAEADDAHVYLASVLSKQGRVGEAWDVLEAGVVLGSSSAHTQLANELSSRDPDDPRIERLYRAAITRGDLEAETNLGIYLLSIGRRAEALALLQRAAARGDDLAREALKAAPTS